MDRILSSSSYVVYIIGIISNSLSGGLIILSFKLKTRSLWCDMLNWVIIVSITGDHWSIRNMLVFSCNMDIQSMIVSTTNVDWGMSRIFRIMTSMSGIRIMKVPAMSITKRCTLSFVGISNRKIILVASYGLYTHVQLCTYKSILVA